MSDASSDDLGLKSLISLVGALGDAVDSSVGAGAAQPIRALGDGLAGLARSPEVALLRQALQAARGVEAVAGAVTPPEVARAVAALRDAVDRLRREGAAPALEVADLVGDALAGLDVLAAAAGLPRPVELEQLRRAVVWLLRPELRLDLALPTRGFPAALAGRLVRTLVEESGAPAPSRAALADLERAVAEAVAGALDRTRRYDPAQPVELRARLRGDWLALEVADRGAGAAPAAGGPDWDVRLLRRVMDEVAYEPAERGGVLRLGKRLT